MPTSTSPQSARELFISHIGADLNLAESTKNTYDRDLLEFFNWCKASRIHPLEIGTSEIESYLVGQRYRRLSPATLAKKLSMLKHFYSFMDSESIIGSDPCAPIYAPKLMRRLPKPLTPKQMAKLLTQPNHETRLGLRDKAILELWYACGLRIAEIQDLRVDDFFAEQMMIRVVGKGDKQRYVPFGQPALRWVTEYLNISRPQLAKLGSPSHLFLNARGQRFSRMGLWKTLRKYAEKCGLAKELTPHIIRHSCATHLLEAGADIRVVMEFLGHADISTTQIYTHLDDLHRRSEYLEFHPRAVDRNDRSDSVQK